MVVRLYSEKSKSVSVDDVKNALQNKGRSSLIIDVRDLTSYYKGHIPGACSLFDGELQVMVKSLDKNANIIVYGVGQAQPSTNPLDRQAGDAIDRLKKNGYGNISELKGGYEAWANSGNRVDSSTPGSIKPASVPLFGEATGR